MERQAAGLNTVGLHGMNQATATVMVLTLLHRSFSWPDSTAATATASLEDKEKLSAQEFD